MSINRLTTTVLSCGWVTAALVAMATPVHASNRSEAHFVLNVAGESAVLRSATSAATTEDGTSTEVILSDGSSVTLRHASDFDEGTILDVFDATADAHWAHCDAAGCDTNSIVNEVIQVAGIPIFLDERAEDLIVEVGDVARLDSLQLIFDDPFQDAAALQHLAEFLANDVYNQMVACDFWNWLGYEELGPQEYTILLPGGDTVTYAYDPETDTWYEIWQTDGVHYKDGKKFRHKRGDKKEGGGKLVKKNGLIWLGPYWFSVPAPGYSMWTPVDLLSIIDNTSLFGQLDTYAAIYPGATGDDLANLATQVLAVPSAYFWSY